MPSAISRAVRLIELMQILQERAWTVEELAERFQVSERTIRRDLLTLQGEPWYYPLVRRIVWQRETWEWGGR